MEKNKPDAKCCKKCRSGNASSNPEYEARICYDKDCPCHYKCCEECRPAPYDVQPQDTEFDWCKDVGLCPCHKPDALSTGWENEDSKFWKCCWKCPSSTLSCEHGNFCYHDDNYACEHRLAFIVQSHQDELVAREREARIQTLDEIEKALHSVAMLQTNNPIQAYRQAYPVGEVIDMLQGLREK